MPKLTCGKNQSGQQTIIFCKEYQLKMNSFKSSEQVKGGAGLAKGNAKVGAQQQVVDKVQKKDAKLKGKHTYESR